MLNVCYTNFTRLDSDLNDFKSFHVVENVSGFPNFKKLFLQLPNGACFAGTIREQLTSGDNTSNIIGYKVNENYGAYILMSVTEVRQYKISGGTIILVGNYLTNSELDIANISKVRMDTGSTNLMTLVYTLPGGLVYELRATETQIQLWKKPANGSYQQLWAK